MQFLVLKMRCGECAHVYYVGEDNDDWEKCPMSFCDGYGMEDDTIIYDLTVDKATGEVKLEKTPDNPKVIRIK